MHYSVPQFIDVEDKIIGPLTMKQFLWLLVGGGIIFILYFLLKFGIWVVMSILVGGIFAALAFFRVYQMPLVDFITAFARFSIIPQIFLWQSTGKPTSKVLTFTALNRNLRRCLKFPYLRVCRNVRGIKWEHNDFYEYYD